MLEALREAIDGRRRIYLLRHGKVAYFDRQGEPYPEPDLPLDEEGQGQARELHRLLAHVPFDRLVTSGLRRTEETAAIVLDGRAAPLPEISVVEDLREIRPGPIAEIPEEDLPKTFTRSLTGILRPDDRFLGGETFGAFEERAVRGFRAVLGLDAWKSLLVVAHGGTNRIVLAHALGAGLPAITSLEQDPACLNIIDVNTDGSFVVRLVNYSPYSPVKDELRMTTMETIFFGNLPPAR